MRRAWAERASGGWKLVPSVAEVALEWGRGTEYSVTVAAVIGLGDAGSLRERQSQVVPRASRPDGVWGFFVCF